jgi:hypothetical protein
VPEGFKVVLVFVPGYGWEWVLIPPYTPPSGGAVPTPQEEKKAE